MIYYTANEVVFLKRNKEVACTLTADITNGYILKDKDRELMSASIEYLNALDATGGDTLELYKKFCEFGNLHARMAYYNEK